MQAVANKFEVQAVESDGHAAHDAFPVVAVLYASLLQAVHPAAVQVLQKEAQAVQLTVVVPEL